MAEVKQKQPQDRKTIFETLSLPVAKILLPVARQAPTKCSTCSQHVKYTFINGCGFFAYSWKLPAYSGALLLTIDNFGFLLTIGTFLLTILASLLTVGAFLLTVGKCVK